MLYKFYGKSALSRLESENARLFGLLRFDICIGLIDSRGYHLFFSLCSDIDILLLSLR